VGRNKEGNKEGKRVTPEVSRRQTIAARREAEDDSKITLIIRQGWGSRRRITVRVRRTSTIQQFKLAPANSPSFPKEEDFSLRLVNGLNLHESLTIGHYQFKDEDQVDARIRLRGC
jgi:hypothetical protein